MYGVESSGIVETVDALARLERLDAQRDLRVEFHAMAEAAKANALSNADSPMQRRAAGTISTTSASGKASASSSTAAVLRFGGDFPGAFGAEYGGERNLQRTVSHFGFYTGWNQFEPWRGSGDSAGYFVWPGIRTAVDDHRPRLAEAVVLHFDAGSDLPGPNLAAGAALNASLLGS
jgi:hypothetical protein